MNLPLVVTKLKSKGNDDYTKIKCYPHNSVDNISKSVNNYVEEWV